MRRRLLALPALVLAALVALAAPAAAHVDVEAEQAVAGATTTLTFSFHHGKDGTATTGLEVLLPEGTQVIEVPEVPGWESQVDEAAGTVTWGGGSSPDGVDARFPVVVTLPDIEGEVLFKTIQTTEAGELAWIQEEADPEEGAYPAPRLVLAPNPNPTTSTTAEATTTTAEVTTSTTRRDGTTLEVEQRDDGSQDATPWLVGSGVAAAVAVGVGGWALKRRMDRAS
ncbi:MAG: DUF1775 domain-containing protein [Actinomycetota bacterium]